MTIDTDLLEFPAGFPGLDKISTGGMYLMGCGGFKQYCCTLRSLLNPSDFCPFCATELRRRGRAALQTMGTWSLFENEFPNARNAKMLLIVPRQHLTSLSQIRPDGAMDLIALLQTCGINDGGLLMRFGDPHYHAGTIEHLHLNVIRPIPGTELRIPLAKNLPDHVKNYQRLLDHQTQLAAKGGMAWLFSSEGVEETQPALA